MLSWIKNLFKKITGGVESSTIKMGEKAQDEHGKIGNHQNVKRTFKIVLGVLLALMIIMRFMDSDPFLFGGEDSFKKETNPNIGISGKKGRYTDEFGGVNGLASDIDVTSNIKVRDLSDDALLNTANSDIKLDDQGNEIPSFEECDALLKKFESGLGLTEEERKKLDVCIEKNEDFKSTLDPKQLAALKKLLNDPNLTDAERRALMKLLNNDLFDGSDEEAAAIGLLNPDKADLAKAYFDALSKGNKTIADILAKKLKGLPLTPEEQALLDAYLNSLKGEDSAEDKSLDDQLKDLGDKKNAINSLRDQVAAAQARASKALAKQAKGLPLTAEEQALVDQFNALNNKLREMEEAYAKEEARLRKLIAERNKQNALYTATWNALQDGTAQTAYEKIDCDTIKPLVKIKNKGKKSKRGKKRSYITKNVLVDESGKKLTPEEISWLELEERRKAQLAKIQDDLIDSTDKDIEFLTDAGDGSIDSSLGRKIDIAKALAAAGGQIEIANTVDFERNALNPFALTPDMKVPAVLETEILISDQGRGQVVRVRVLDDVISPQTNNKVIPKNSVIIGFISGFDAETGIADFSFDKVSIGSGKVLDTKFIVGSADGTMGLKGQVTDTTGKYLLGAFVTAFSGGALNFFSQQVVQPFLDDEENIGAALQGSAGQGAAEVMTRISEMYAEKLQNAAKIYYAPKGLPIILYPNP